LKRVVATALLVFVIVLGFVFDADAIAPRIPYPWEIVFEDANRILYMTPQPHSEWVLADLIEEFGEERMEIRSGLYYNTAPLQNIYYLDRFFHQGTAFFSACGMYFASVWVDPSMAVIRGNVIHFYGRGSLIRRHRAEDLIGNSNHTARTQVGYVWIKPGTLEHNMSENTLSLTTTNNRAYIFDITTGEIVSMYDYYMGPSTLTIAAIATLPPLVLILLAARFISKRKGNPEDSA